MAGLWPAHSLAGLPLVVILWRGKALILFALWVNVLIVGLLEAICGLIGVCPLCWYLVEGEGCNGVKMGLGIIPAI